MTRKIPDDLTSESIYLLNNIYKFNEKTNSDKKKKLSKNISSKLIDKNNTSEKLNDIKGYLLDKLNNNSNNNNDSKTNNDKIKSNNNGNNNNKNEDESEMKNSDFRLRDVSNLPEVLINNPTAVNVKLDSKIPIIKGVDFDKGNSIDIIL